MSFISVAKIQMALDKEEDYDLQVLGLYGIAFLVIWAILTVTILALIFTIKANFKHFYWEHSKMLWLALFLLTVPVFFRGFINTFRWFYKPLNAYWEVNNGVMDAVFTLIFKLGMGIAQLTSLLFGYIRR